MRTGVNKIDGSGGGWKFSPLGCFGGTVQGPKESGKALQDVVLMSYWRMLANSTWQPLRVPHKSSFKSQFGAFLSLFSIRSW